MDEQPQNVGQKPAELRSEAERPREAVLYSALVSLSARWRELAQAYRNAAGNERHLSKGNSLRDDAKMLCYCADALDDFLRQRESASIAKIIDR
jgi:hypothetical protein